MNNRKCSPACALMNSPDAAERFAKSTDDLNVNVCALVDQLLSVRTAAEEVRNYVSRIIVKTDELLEVLDEADWDFGIEEDAE